jgi:hypothetical protein
MPRYDPSLPLHSFGPGQREQPLQYWSDNGHYIFRMWRSNGERSNVPGPLGIVAPRFQRALEDEAALKSTINAHREKILRHIPNTADCHGGSSSSRGTSTHRIMNEHVEDWRRKDQIAKGTPFVSTSMSLFWVIANGIKSGTTDIHISIIRVKDVDPRSLFIVSRHVAPGKAFTFSDQSQEVLVHGLIPRAALISTFPLADLLAVVPLWVPEHQLSDDYYGGQVACKGYAVQWAEAFLKQTRDKRARHGHEMIWWAWDMLNFAQKEFGGWSDENDVFQLSLYLYRWPFRGHPGAGTAAPSIQVCGRIIRTTMDEDGMALYVISRSIYAHTADRASRPYATEDEEDDTSEEDSDSEDDLADQLERMTLSQSVT